MGEEKVEENIRFICSTNVDDHIKMKLGEMAYWFTGMGLLLILVVWFSFLMTGLDGDEFSTLGSVLFAFVSIPFTVLYMVGLYLFIWFIALIGKVFWRKKWDRDADHLVTFTDRNLVIEADVGFEKRIDTIPLDHIRSVSREVIPYFHDLKIKIPWWYRPIVQAAPDPDKHHSLLYYKWSKRDLPLDYLLRLDMKEIVHLKEIRAGYPRFEDRKFVYKWVDRPAIIAIISIRPEDQDLFIRLLNVRIGENITSATPSLLVSPPA